MWELSCCLRLCRAFFHMSQGRQRTLWIALECLQCHHSMLSCVPEVHRCWAICWLEGVRLRDELHFCHAQIALLPDGLCMFLHQIERMRPELPRSLCLIIKWVTVAKAKNLYADLYIPRSSQESKNPRGTFYLSIVISLTEKSLTQKCSHTM